MRQWLTKMLARISGTKTTRIQDMFGSVPIHQFASIDDQLRVVAGKVWASFKAVDIIAQAVTTIPFKVVRGTSSDPINVPGLTDRLLVYPNNDETFSDLVYKTVFHLKATGKAFWFKDQATVTGERPLGLYSLNPKNVKVAVAKGGNSITGYIVTTAGQQVPLDVNEVMYFRRPHPTELYGGIGDVEAGESLFNEHINRNSWTDKFWQNGATPSGLLICEEGPYLTDDEDFEKAKKRWHAEYGGKKNAGKTAWLTGKWRYEQLGMSAVEMQDLERTRATIEAIFLLHGVPLSVAGIRDAANYATASIDEKRFRIYAVAPIVKLLEDTINTDLIAGYGTGLKMRYAISGMVNVGQVATEYAPLFDRGVISINEMRELVGLQPDADNDLWNQHFISSGLVPLELSGVTDDGDVALQAQRMVDRFTTNALLQRQ